MNELFYKGETIKLGISNNVLSDNLTKVFSEYNIDKYVNDKDLERLGCSREFLKNMLNPHNHQHNKLFHQIDLFKNMLDKNYFTEKYQIYLEKLKLDGIEEYFYKMEKIYAHIIKNQEKYSNINEEVSIRDIQIYNEFDLHSSEASSGYSTINSDEEKDQEEQELNRENQGDYDMRQDNEFDGSLSDERFRNLKTNKNQLTINSRTEEEIKEFQRQEMDRYKSPHLPWTYYNVDGEACVVAPVQKKMPSGSTSKPRDHFMLKSDRPSYVTILCLARDAAARLPEGVGTRADICDLLKDSQFINERLSDSQVNNIVSGALDRLHYEKDPCVKYDLQKKLWIYLHKNRGVDYPPWVEHLKEAKTENKLEISLNQDEKMDESYAPELQSSGKKSRKDRMLKHKRKNSSIINQKIKI